MKKSLFIVWALMCCYIFPASAEITLAIIAPKAGEFVEAGNELFEGARLAVQEINDNGGVNGEKLDMLTIDDRCDDRLAVSTAEMLSLLKSKKIGLVVGPYCSNQFDEIAAIYEKSKIFQIVPTTEAYYSGSVDKKGRVLLLSNKAQMSKDFFKFYNQNFAGLKVGFVYDSSVESGYADVAKTLYDEFRHYGKADLLKFYVLQGDDLGDVVDALIYDKREIVFVLSSAEKVSSIIYSTKSENKNIIFFTSKKSLSDDVLDDLGNKANGLYLFDVLGLEDSLLFTDSLVNLRLLGIEPKGLETYSYVAIKLWGDLVNKVKSFDYQKLSRAANSEELKEKWGEFLIHSGSQHQAKYVIEEYRGGDFKQVY